MSNELFTSLRTSFYCHWPHFPSKHLLNTQRSVIVQRSKWRWIKERVLHVALYYNRSQSQESRSWASIVTCTRLRCLWVTRHLSVSQISLVNVTLNAPAYVIVRSFCLRSFKDTHHCRVSLGGIWCKGWYDVQSIGRAKVLYFILRMKGDIRTGFEEDISHQRKVHLYPVSF